jgi:hypothetical protein
MFMIFHKKRSMIIVTLVLIVVYLISIIKNHNFQINLLIVAIYFIIILVSICSFIIIKDGKLSKYSVLIKTFEIQIREIKIVEAITLKKWGEIFIKVGKSPTEDYYMLITKDNVRYKIDRSYMNKGISFGRYLNKEYKIQLLDKDKMTFIDWDIT